MNTRSLSLCLALTSCLTLLAGCPSSSGGNGAVADDAATAKAGDTAVAKAEDDDAQAAAEPSKASPEAIATLAKGNNDFAIAMYGQLASGAGNVFFSPLSIRTALAMTFAGARDETASQMETTLRFSQKDDALHAAFLAAGEDLLGDSNGVELTIANSLWGQSGYKFLDPFVDLNKRYYGGNLSQVDFVTAPEKARAEINGWVEKKTKERIKDLIPSGVLDALTRLVLVNAVYFKGTWLRSFAEDNTNDAPFHASKDEQLTAKMMHQKDEARYAEVDGVQILELPYTGERLAMMVILPRDKDGLAEVEKSLTADQIDGWAKRLEGKEVDVFLPRFKLEGDTIPLKKQLSAMGMPIPFDKTKADFSGMNGQKQPSAEALHIAEVFHQAFVEVNEKGTEAAAATAVIMKARGAKMPMETTPVFRADHPFLFLLRDTKTGSILFMGRLAKPT